MLDQGVEKAERGSKIETLTHIFAFSPASTGWPYAFTYLGKPCRLLSCPGTRYRQGDGNQERKPNRAIPFYKASPPSRLVENPLSAFPTMPIPAEARLRRPRVRSPDVLDSRAQLSLIARCVESGSRSQAGLRQLQAGIL